MKTITIRLPNVEAAMLVEVQRVNKRYKDVKEMLIELIHIEYEKIFS